MVNNIECISYIDAAIKAEMLLGPAKNENRLTGLRNIKSDFNYIVSREPKLDTLDVLNRLYRERRENESTYKDADKTDLWLQEHTEAEIIARWLPSKPETQEVLNYLGSLTDIPKKKSSFKRYQDSCVEHFGQKIDSSIILDFINAD